MLLYTIADYIREKGKETTRLRMSAKTVRLICCREALRDSFSDAVLLETAELGWLGFRKGEQFFFIKADAADSWTSLGSRRAKPLRRRIKSGDAAEIEAVVEEIMAAIETILPGEEEDED